MCAHALQVRVRVAVGDCLQVLAQLRGGQVLELCVERVMLSIHEHYVSISVIALPMAGEAGGFLRSSPSSGCGVVGGSASCLDTGNNICIHLPLSCPTPAATHTGVVPLRIASGAVQLGPPLFILITHTPLIHSSPLDHIPLVLRGRATDTAWAAPTHC